MTERVSLLREQSLTAKPYISTEREELVQKPINAQKLLPGPSREL